MRWIALLCIMLLPVAAAQSGPAPGYDSATDYALAYTEDQAAEAAADPAGYAGDHASAEAVRAEAEHAAYMACWAADDHDVQHEACDPYYTPRGRADPEQPQEAEPAAQQTKYLVNETVDATDELAREALDGAEDLVDDPSTAPTFVERMVDATQRFLARITGAVEAFVAGLGDVLHGIGALGPLVSDLGIAAADGLVQGLGAAGDGAADLGASATGGIAEAGAVTGDAAEGAWSAAGDAVAAVQEAMAGWFDTPDAPTTPPTETPVEAPVDTDGLLDVVPEVLE